MTLDRAIDPYRSTEMPRYSIKWWYGPIRSLDSISISLSQYLKHLFRHLNQYLEHLFRHLDLFKSSLITAGDHGCSVPKFSPIPLFLSDFR